jgi:hypothetical protein
MKNNQKRWLYYIYDVPYFPLLKVGVISLALGSFKTKVLNKISKDSNILLLVKVKFIDGNYKTLNFMQLLELKNKNKEILKLVRTLGYNLELKNKQYHTIAVDKFIFSYMFVSQKDAKIINKQENKNLQEKKKSMTFKMYGYNLPSWFYSSYYNIARK